MPKSNHKPNPLKLLTSAALALPALSNAGTVADQSQVSYRYSHYQEDPAKASLTVKGDTERYTIDIHQFHLISPIDEKTQLDIDLLTESMSGASPWNTQTDNQGKPQVIMSGASIQEERTEFNVQGKRLLNKGSLSMGMGFSQEYDYSSASFSTNREWEKANNRTYNLGFSFSKDHLKPTQGTTETNIIQGTKQSISIFAGGSQIINRNAILQTGFSITNLSGFLSDTYKAGDQRPDQRNQYTATIGWRQYFTTLDASLHLDGRYYIDDWEIFSYTVASKWYQPITDKLKLIPSFRYYSQNQAKFYTPFFTDQTQQRYFSTDYRLSPYGAISGGLKLKYHLAPWNILMSIERYQSGAGFAIRDVEIEHPALVSFTRFSMGVNLNY